MAISPENLTNEAAVNWFFHNHEKPEAKAYKLIVDGNTVRLGDANIFVRFLAKCHLGPVYLKNVLRTCEHLQIAHNGFQELVTKYNFDRRANYRIQKADFPHVFPVAQVLTTTPAPPQHPHNDFLRHKLGQMIFKNHQLPGAGGATKKTGEEHINAILYQVLIEEKKRSEVVILPLINNQPPAQLDYHFDPTVRYVVAALSVNDNMHNTIIVIDRHKKEYHYFDSLAPKNDCPSSIKEIFQKADILASDFKKANTQSSEQKDGWSCGFHAVDNALLLIEREQSHFGKQLDGNTLRDRYVPQFERFALCHGRTTTGEEAERINKIQKMQIRDALTKLVSGHREHPLYNLEQYLVAELHPDSATRPNSLANCAERYIDSHKDDVIAQKILQAATEPSGSIYAHLPQDVSETAATREQTEQTIRLEIERLLKE